MTAELHDYQKRAVEFLHENPRAYLALRMGAGKTLSVLSALRPEDLPVLVIGPKRVAEDSWPKEVAKWRPDLTVSVAAGTPKKRQEAFAKNADITTVGFSNIADAPANYKTVVVDEASGIKNKSTKRWKEVRRLTKPAANRWLLSGTPAANSLMDLWAQYAVLDEGQRLETSLTKFRARYFYPAATLPTGVVIQYKLKPGADDSIHKAIADITFSEAPAIEIPHLVNDIEVTLPPKVRKVYDEFKREAIAEFESTEVVALQPATLTNKLGQVSSGFIYDEDGDTTWLHEAKLDVLREIVDDAGGPVLVWVTYKAEAGMIRKAFPEARSASEKGAIDDWNAGKIPVMYSNPASLGHGVNLQHGGSTAVYFSLPWSLELYEQSIARLARQGQTRTVITHRLIGRDTVDHAKVDTLDRKATGQQALFDYLKGNRS